MEMETDTHADNYGNGDRRLEKRGVHETVPYLSYILWCDVISSSTDSSVPLHTSRPPAHRQELDGLDETEHQTYDDYEHDDDTSSPRTTRTTHVTEK
jgi:hypothetical protein